MPELGVLIYLIAVGFALAGLTQSAIQLGTGKPLRFALDHRDGALFVAGLLARLVAGPVILMRNGLALSRQNGQPVQWLAMTTFIAGLWSFFSGLLVVSLFA